MHILFNFVFFRIIEMCFIIIIVIMKGNNTPDDHRMFSN